MDAGVLELHLFQHDAVYEPMRLSGSERISPRLRPDSEVGEIPGATLVVPTYYNRDLKSDSLAHVLSGIEASQCIRQVVLVAADGNVASLAPLQEICQGIECSIVACEPERRALARNCGVASAKEGWLIFLDDDMLLQDWRLADVILSEMTKDGFDAALFPRRHFAKFPLLYQTSSLARVVERWRLDKLRQEDAELILDPVQDGSPFKTMAFCFPGCFMAISREAYERIGGFPEKFSGWGFEDTQFAMQAVEKLRVLNLFRAAPPLLHIDHPVSPYKSEEYQRNLKRFYSEYKPLDMEWLCREVFRGDNFEPRVQNNDSHEVCGKLLCDALKCYPLPSEQLCLLQNFRHVVEVRVKRGLDPIPRYVALIGSRANATHTNESDHDLLILFRGGAYAEHFFVAGTEAVDVENASTGKFEEIAAVPVSHVARAPLELSKIADANLLAGDPGAFELWRDELLDIGLSVGLPVWLLYGIGMWLRESKYASAIPTYFQAILRILNSRFNSKCNERGKGEARHGSVASTMESVKEPTGSSVATWDPANYRFVLDALASGQMPEVVCATRQIMDRDLSEWRSDMQANKRVFAVQVPEIWHALNHLLEMENSSFDGKIHELVGPSSEEAATKSNASLPSRSD